jgi:hypothetical protein
MDVRMLNRLSGYFAAVNTNVETLHRAVPREHLCPDLVHELIDGPSLRFEQLEERGNVALRYDQRMQLCHREVVQYREGESVRCNDSLVRYFVEYTARLTRVDALSDYSEVLIISRAFIGVAFKTECLKVRKVILTAMLSRHDVVHLDARDKRGHDENTA